MGAKNIQIFIKNFSQTFNAPVAVTILLSSSFSRAKLLVLHYCHYSAACQICALANRISLRRDLAVASGSYCVVVAATAENLADGGPLVVVFPAVALLSEHSEAAGVKEVAVYCL